MEHNEPLVSIKEIERMTGLPRSWLYSASAAGRVPHYKIGKYLKFSPSEVLRWLESHRRGNKQTDGGGGNETHTRPR